MTPSNMNVESDRLNIAEGLPPYVALAMAYVPFQKMRTVYEPEVALVQGTIFPELDKPWYAGCVNMALKDNMQNAEPLMMERERSPEYYRKMEYPNGNRYYEERGARR